MERSLAEAKKVIKILKKKCEGRPNYILRTEIDQFWFFGQLDEEAKEYVSGELDKVPK